MGTDALGMLWRTALDIAEASGAVELLRQRLEVFLERWPERDELLQRFTLLPEAHRKNLLERVAMHLAIHKLDSDGMLQLIKSELGRAETNVRHGR